MKEISKSLNTDSKEIWITQNLSSLITTGSQNIGSFSNNLSKLVQKASDGNINDFAYLTGVWHVSVRRLLKGEVLPTMKMLIGICYTLDFPIIDLFDESTKSDETNKHSLVEIKRYTKEDVRLKLPAFLAEVPPPSANEVSRRIGWQTTRFQRNFLDIYKQVVERYLEYQSAKLPNLTDEDVERVLNNAISEIPAPSLQSVFRRIGCRNTGYRYYLRFPNLCEKIAIRYKNANRKNFDIEKAKQVLKSALKEIPTPSFSEVARRLKCSRNILSKKLPKLSAKLHKKYESDLKDLRKQNRQAMYKEVITVINELQNRQMLITENAVRKLTKKKWNDKNFKLAYKEIRENWEVLTGLYSQ